MNGTLFLCSVTTESTKTGASARKTGNPHIIGDGTPLPLEKLNWEVEDFNPEAFGGGKMAVPQKQLVAALKLWVTKLTGDVNGDFTKACKKLDADADDKIDEKEFDDWIDKQPFDQRVKTVEGEIMDAMWEVLKEKDEDFMTMDSCKKDMDKFVGPKGIFNTPPATR